jgi:hypothetical protein
MPFAKVKGPELVRSGPPGGENIAATLSIRFLAQAF